MKTKQMRNWLMVLLIVLSTAAVCLAQSDTARLQGTVTDPQGNAVSGAVVNVTSVETGRLSTATTSELGYYTVTALPRGITGWTSRKRDLRRFRGRWSCKWRSWAWQIFSWLSVR